MLLQQRRQLEICLRSLPHDFDPLSCIQLPPNANLLNIAEKATGRQFRLLVPILASAMVEYFSMDAGATAWLEYLPSVTWSTWPFTTVRSNFGNFISKILELAYLIPNAAHRSSSTTAWTSSGLSPYSCRVLG